jgi:hypothetical protein
MRRVVSTFTSRCGQYKAEIERRSSGALEVIPYKWTRDWNPDYGMEEFWQEVRFMSSLTNTLKHAEALAREKVLRLGGVA